MLAPLKYRKFHNRLNRHKAGNFISKKFRFGDFWRTRRCKRQWSCNEDRRMWSSVEAGFGSSTVSRTICDSLACDFVQCHVRISTSATQVQHTSDDADRTREETRAAFYHGYRSYMNYGFPADELRPLSCIGRGSDKLNSYMQSQRH